VYSGVKGGKSWAYVPSPYDICVRVLQENTDSKSKMSDVMVKDCLLLDSIFAHVSSLLLFFDSCVIAGKISNEFNLIDTMALA
jgi:hypothetical protein